MTHTFKTLALMLLLSAGSQAANINTNLTVNAAGTFSVTSGLNATGTATLSNIGTGTFTATLPLSGVGPTTATAQFTITLAGGGGTITGTITVPTGLFVGATQSGNGSATVTGGTGPYAGATGSFPSLSGTASGSIATSFLFTFSGAGTVITGGTGPGPGPGGPTPTITAVLDAGSYTKNIAQGSIFVVKGSNMSGSGLKQLGFPLPTTTDGVKITFTPAAGGAGTDAFLVYTYNQGGVNQLAGVLPSTLAAGNYNVTVTNSGATSPPVIVPVVQRKIGLITADSSGSGLVVVQNYVSAAQLDINRFTTGSVSGTPISPAKPGQVLIAWGTGMGPVTGGDNTASPGFDFAANGVTVRVIVGGVSITPLYAGRAPGLAGADQINFTLPANVPTGCTVDFQVSVNGVLSNPTFIAIAPDSASSACVSPGFTTAQLQRFDQGGTFTVGGFGLSQVTVTGPQFGTIKQNTASGTFIQFNGFQLASGSSQVSGFTPGTCQIYHVTTGQDSPGSSINYTTLDAGAVSLNGPAASGISNRAFQKLMVTDPTTGKVILSYYMPLMTEGLPAVPGAPAETGVVVGGNYTLTGAGGRDVGAFSTSIAVGTPISITGGLPSTVNRGAGLTVNWTGGNATDIVQIQGNSSTRTGTGANAITDSWSFFCYATAGQGTFSVPSSILNQLPPVAIAANGSGGGTLGVFSTPNPTNGNGFFTAPLTAGGSIDSGLFTALIGFSNTVSYQ